ncbi:unnamed protein product [Paramecium pentaurelia]|uniref:Uncharacterized protein n=1 Tax=Paramecium pentaurelia TaxID=43138 RepID=A0A8S1TK99_9CILI|nr:unnamed protein product [Paramecium pentaurelia]
MFHQKPIKSKCWNCKQDFLITILKIVIKFTSIYQTNIQVPQILLIFSPVEMMLSDIYLIISADHPDLWYYVNYASFKKKIEILDRLKESIIQNIKCKSKQKDYKEDGYLIKSAFKFLITYNLTISIIQIKFEDTINKQFLCGLSIKTKGIK